MKTGRFAGVVAAVVAALALAGCWVSSLNPYASEDKAVFEEELLGVWTGADEEKLALEFERAGGRGAYTLRVTEEKGEEKGEAMTLDGTLFRLGDALYLQVGVADEGRSLPGPPFVLRGWQLARVELTGDQLLFRSPSPKWFEDRAKGGGLDLPHSLAQGGVVLTASTAQLQEWFARNGGAEGVFDEPIAFRRRR